jgi:hypothetical protein
LLLVHPLLLDQGGFFVSRVTQQSARDGTHHATDCGTRSCFAVLVADQSAGDSSRNAAQSCAALLLDLSAGRKGNQAYRGDGDRAKDCVGL